MVKTLKQFDPLIIEEIKETSFSCFHHSHNYYEVVYILQGKGTHLFNENRVCYEPGDLFLLAPGDQHSFDIEDPTHFIYVKFTDLYFESKRHLAPDEFRVGSPEILMEMKWLKEVKICIKSPCDSILRSTMGNLVEYAKYKEVANSPIVYYQLLSVFGMIREILRGRQMAISGNNLNHEQMLSYIHENIYDRESLQVTAIAAKFNISSSYFSNFFKRHFNSSYQQYLDEYRISLVKKRLEIGGLKLKEIAMEFGFTDSSHLAKTFKRVTGQSPKQYVE